MTEKQQWRKHEKSRYLPKNKPELIELKSFKFICLEGEGNPNSEAFSKRVEALFSLAYAIKMQLKKAEEKPATYCDFSVYPLEGVWDINKEAKARFNGVVNKDDLSYTLMIRQPDFVDESLFNQLRDCVQTKKPSPYISSISFEEIEEGRCIQMLHLGCYENESVSFALMESFAEQQGFSRNSKVHREIYLSDARRVSPDKYKTVLRFCVQDSSTSE
ncbi:hypothetical protein DBZ36_00860 [Alginatibacterium sediminis]|uniref:GyrI-like small molecule binding domain-containing protein n=1 Tax=Alginatibacterium sediminis TaxID=2164068 RepID=A0A420END4_9ALTE|nr:GyrI-like domain-containing protein [Alginatibacterium sediminis]RKF22227.1 hypothetical protein DBZ36_00860 [Alginatibacterium sediminis]